MSAFKPYPEVSLEVSDESSAMRIVNSKGETLVTDTTCDTATLERIVDCWNACRKLYSPANHIEATDEYVKRLETLRRDAWARAETLQAQIDATPTPEHTAQEGEAA
jgi:hypothetical protein